MAVHYKPNLNLNDLLFYYDASNTKSFANTGVWNSMIGTGSITTNAVLSGGYLTKPDTTSNSTSVSLDGYNSITFIVSAKLSADSDGTIFSVYGTLNQRYLSSTILGLPTLANKSASALLTASYTYNVVTSAQTTPAILNSTTTATATSYAYGYAVSAQTTQAILNSTTTATATSYAYNFNASAQTTPAILNSTTTVSSIQQYSSYPDALVSMYASAGQVGATFQNSSDLINQTTGGDIGNNDVFAAVFTKGTSTSKVKIYKNGSLVSTNTSTPTMTTFGSTMSILNKLDTTDYSNFPVRIIAAYSRELSATEILLASTSLKQT